jgi:hypothetical protein
MVLHATLRILKKVLGWISIALAGFAVTMGWINAKSYFSHPHPTDTRLVTVPVAANAKFNAPYPFTAQQLWANILKVTALPDGKLTQTEIENAFGTTLHPDSNPITKDTTFKTSAGQNWYFSLSLKSSNLFGNNSEIFFLDWKDRASSYGSPPPEGMCINVNDIKPSLLAQGWIENTKKSSNDIMSKVEYDKGHLTGLIMAYDADSRCLKQLSLVAPTN